MTSVERIKLQDHPDDLEKVVQQTCDIKGTFGYYLASSFVYKNDLLLVFQRTPHGSA